MLLFWKYALVLTRLIQTCNESLAKKKVATHRCDGGYTCIDCSVTFYGMDFKAHNTCISEAEKYQGALYKAKPTKQQNKQNNQKKAAPAPAPAPTPKKEEEKPKVEKKEEKKSKKTSALSLTSVVPKNKASSLYKIVKQLESDSKKSKKDILKDLVVSQNSDGTITLNFK